MKMFKPVWSVIIDLMLFRFFFNISDSFEEKQHNFIEIFASPPGGITNTLVCTKFCEAAQNEV